MAAIEESVDVQVPARTAYDEWAGFEPFPDFMDEVVEVRRISEVRLHWVAVIDGERREWDAEITEDEPGRRIAWRSTSGTRDDGRVDFTPTDDGTRVDVRMDREDEGAGAGASAGTESADESITESARERVKRLLERFKHLIESRDRRPGGQREAPIGPEGYPEGTSLPALDMLGDARARPGRPPGGDGPGRLRGLAPRLRALPRGQDGLARQPYARAAGQRGRVRLQRGRVVPGGAVLDRRHQALADARRRAGTPSSSGRSMRSTTGRATGRRSGRLCGSARPRRRRPRRSPRRRPSRRWPRGETRRPCGSRAGSASPRRQDAKAFDRRQGCHRSRWCTGRSACRAATRGERDHGPHILSASRSSRIRWSLTAPTTPFARRRLSRTSSAWVSKPSWAMRASASSSSAAAIPASPGRAARRRRRR